MSRFAMKVVRKRFAIRDYDLAATLTSGQAFRWKEINGGWEGVIGEHWVRLTQDCDGIDAETLHDAEQGSLDWNWLRHYLQLDLDLASVVCTFPADDVA